MSSSGKRSHSDVEIYDNVGKSKRNQDILSEGSIENSTPFTNFTNKKINISSFKVILLRIQADNRKFESDHCIDLDVSDLVYKSPDKIVENAIQNVASNTLLKDTSLESLLAGGYIPFYNDLVKQREESNLYSVRHLRTAQDTKLKPREVNYVPKTGSTSVSDEVPVVNDVLISVSLFHPKKNVKTQTFSVLGSQCLTQLRDRFYCLSNVAFEGTGSFFFIENQFYSDHRNPESTDYVSRIVAWMSAQSLYWKRLLEGQKTIKTMADTKFEDLSIFIGKKYLFCHSGDCEHIITFDEIREIGDNDSKNFQDYPKHIFQNKIRRRKCRICKTFSAKYITYNDPQAPEIPCHFCEDCFKPLHFDKSGNTLNSDLEVYEYQHD